MNPCRWLLRAVVLPTAVLLATTGPAHAAAQANPAPNQLYGHITSNRTLTVAAPGPNYEIIGDLTVDPGVTLTLERGIVLRATPNADFLATGNPERVELVVYGHLLIPEGNDALIVGSTGGQSDWAGVATRGQGRVTFNDVELRDAPVVLSIEGAAPCVLQRCRLRSGLSIASGTVSILSSTFLGGSSVAVSSGAVDIAGCEFRDAGITVSGNSHVTVADCTLAGGGILYSQPASGSVLRCTISQAQTGLKLTPNVSTAVADSLAPQPSYILGCGTGLVLGNHQAEFATFKAEHLLIANCLTGVQCYDANGFGASMTLNYLSIIDCPTGVSSSKSNYAMVETRVYNSLVCSDVTSGTGLYVYNGSRCDVAHSDVWGYAFRGGVSFGTGNIVLGEGVSSFNPFIDKGAGYHLNPASFFTNASASGGEIGAYGPGPGSPVPVSGASVVSADAGDGVSRIRWYVGDPGRKASIIRRVDGGDWEPKTVLYADGTGYVDLEDRDVTPGTRYGYAVGTQQAGQIGIDGEVWLTVELPALSEGRLSIVPNPATDGWAVRFTSSVPVEGTVEVVDLAGRCVSSQDLGLISPGTHSAYVPASSLAPGVYWIRLLQGADLLQARAVKTK